MSHHLTFRTPLTTEAYRRLRDGVSWLQVTIHPDPPRAVLRVRQADSGPAEYLPVGWLEVDCTCFLEEGPVIIGEFEG